MATRYWLNGMLVHSNWSCFDETASVWSVDQWSTRKRSPVYSLAPTVRKLYDIPERRVIFNWSLIDGEIDGTTDLTSIVRDKLCCNVAGKTSVLRKIKPICRSNALHLLDEKTIQHVFDYGCSVWCDTKQSNISKLQRSENYAARIVTGQYTWLKGFVWGTNALVDKK